MWEVEKEDGKGREGKGRCGRKGAVKVWQGVGGKKGGKREQKLVELILFPEI